MSSVAVQLGCGCWAGSAAAEVGPDGLQVACLRHNVQPVVTRPDILEVVLHELLVPTVPVPKEAAWM